MKLFTIYNEFTQFIFQVQGKSDQSSKQILSMLTSAMSEASSVIADVPLSNGDSHLNSTTNTSSKPPPSSPLSSKDTFQSATLSHFSDSSKSGDQGEKTDAFASAREMLQPLVGPLVGQLSQEISGPLLEILREKIDKLKL